MVEQEQEEDEGEGKHMFDSEMKMMMMGSNKRKFEEEIQFAKQKAQEIATRLFSDAEPKRPRLLFHDDVVNLSKPSSLPNPPLPDDARIFSSHQIANSQVGSVPFGVLPGHYYSSLGTSKRFTILSRKVALVIGRGGETIKHLELQSGANIQITKDSDADPYSETRDVELRGTPDQIRRAEQLINDIVTETDVRASALSVPVTPGTGIFTMKVPNDKVASVIGKGGETIRSIQDRTGACLQNRLSYPSWSNSYVQPVNTSAGNWDPPGQPPMQQQPGHGYTQTGHYATPSPYYGAYPTQVAASDQSNPSAVPPPSQQGTGYNYYKPQGQTGSEPPNFGYSYSQTPSITSQSYDQGFSLQILGYGQGISNQVLPFDQQNFHASPGYGPTAAAASQLDGTIPIQSTQQFLVCPFDYNQVLATAQAGYWAAPTYMLPHQLYFGYNQMGFIQPGYGGQQSVQVYPLAAQPVYEQGGYPPQPAPAPSRSAQGEIHPAYAQPQRLPQLSQSQQAVGFLSVRVMLLKKLVAGIHLQVMVQLRFRKFILKAESSAS